MKLNKTLIPIRTKKINQISKIEFESKEIEAENYEHERIRDEHIVKMLGFWDEEHIDPIEKVPFFQISKLGTATKNVLGNVIIANNLLNQLITSLLD